MSRKAQYFGLSLMVCAVLVYIGTLNVYDHERGLQETRFKLNVTHAPAKYTEYLSLKKKLKKDGKITGQDQTITKLCNSLMFELNLEKFNRSRNKEILKEKQHIAFLKVHKAASTTLQTMFFRFGFERNLSFVLPVKGNYFSHSSKVHQDIISPRHGDHYDIICNHGIFGQRIYSSLMPNDTVYLAVVRNPLDQFISAVKYYTEVYGFQYLVNIPGNRIENLIEFPDSFDSPLSYTRNSMARDFGFQKHHVANHTMKGEAECYLKELDNVFDFVLIAEHFDESLILMRRLLNWSLRDILYISKNVRGSGEVINERLKQQFRKRNQLDYLLYDFFYNKFQNIFKEFEEDVIAEITHFKKVLVTVQNWCNNNTEGNLTIESSSWNEKFFIYNRDCILMVKHELKFIKLLKGNSTEN